MDDLVKIYDTRRGTSWVEGKGYGTVCGTRSGNNNSKKGGGGGGNNWSNIISSLKKLGSSNSSSEKTQSSPNTAAHNYYMPFSVIPVEAPSSAQYQHLQHQKYRSLSTATGNPYLRHSSPHLHNPVSMSQNHHHGQGIIDYSMQHANEFSHIHPFRSRTVRSPKASKRSSLFDSTWEPLSQHHPHLRHQQLHSHHPPHPPPSSSHQSHIHGSCTCSQASNPIRGGVSNRYPVDQTTAIYSEGGSEKMRSVQNGAGSGRRIPSTASISTAQVRHNCTESRLNANLCESGKLMKHEYSGLLRAATSPPDPSPSSTVLGTKLSRSAYTTLGGGFMRALRKNSKDPTFPCKPVTAYDLIEQQFGREIEDDDDLSDNIIESSQYPDTSATTTGVSSSSSSTLPVNGSKKKLMLKRGTESVSQSYSSRFVDKSGSHPERGVGSMSAKEAEDLLTKTNLNLRIGGQGVTFNSWNQTMPTKKKSSSGFGSGNKSNSVSSSSQIAKKNELMLKEVEIVENYSVPEPDYDVDDDEDENFEIRTSKMQPQFSRRDDNHDEVECDHPSSTSHHPDQVAIQRETTTTCSSQQKQLHQQKDNLLNEYYSSNGSNLVNANGSSSIYSSSSSSCSDEHFKSAKKSILKKFTLDSKTQLDSSEANRSIAGSNCNEQQFEGRIDGETNEGIETSSESLLQQTLHNTSYSSCRKAPTLPSRTNMMNKLKRKTRKHVTFRSLSDDTLMLEQINEPIMEEEEPLYDDVECVEGDNDNVSSTSMDPSNLGTRRMSSYSSSTPALAASAAVATTTTTSSSDEANDQNNHHLHTNSPSIGSTSGNVKNVDLHSRSVSSPPSSKKELSCTSLNNKNEAAKKDSQIKYSSSLEYICPRSKSKPLFVTCAHNQNHEESIISSKVIPGAISNNGTNERSHLIDPSASAADQIRKNGGDMEKKKNASIINKASFYPDPVEYDPAANPNKDINSRDTRSAITTHHSSSPPSNCNSSAPGEEAESKKKMVAIQPQVRNRKKAIDAYPNDVKNEALEYSLKHSQRFNDQNFRDHFNLIIQSDDHGIKEVDDQEQQEEDLTDEEEDEDKYESHKSTFTVSVVNRIDRSLCSNNGSDSSSSATTAVGRSKRRQMVTGSAESSEKGGRGMGGVVGNELKCECNKIVIDVSSGNVYETIQGQDQEHIYEEVGLLNRRGEDDQENEQDEEGEQPEGKKSIFDGASKDEILEYLEDAKERVDVLINSSSNNVCSGNMNCEDGRMVPTTSLLLSPLSSPSSHREVMMSPDMRVIEEEEVGRNTREVGEENHGVIDAITGEVVSRGGGSRKKRGSSSSASISSPPSSLCKSRSGVAVSAENLIESTITTSSASARRNRTSNVSNSSTDSAVTTSSSLEDESSLRSGPLITSSVSLTQLVERNDSGVGTETSSRPTRLRRSSSAIVGESEQRCTDCEQVFDPQVQYDEPSASGFTSFFPLTCNKCDKKRSERREIISEFVETEFKYGRDLRIIREEFYRPVEVAGLLSKEQIKSVFLNLDELINVNSRFSEKLQDALDIATEQGDEEYTTVNLGRLFMDSSSMLLAFETYCSQQGSASLILAHLEKEKELLRIFLRVSQMENTHLRRMNLSAFLMVPVQRVTKYPLLLNRLYKVTPYHHRDREALKAAQQKVELHLEHINQQTKSAPNKIWRRISNLSVANRRLPAVLEDIGNMKLRKAALDALKWSREDSSFVLCGKLLFAPVTESSSSSSTTKKGRTIKFLPIHALLVAFGTPTEHYRPDLAETDDPMKTFSSGRTGITDAALVVIKDKSSRYTLCHEPLHLSSCIIRMESEDDDVFEVHEMNKDSFMFKAESSDIAKQWFKHLGYHSRDLGGWRRRRNAMANIMMVR